MPSPYQFHVREAGKPSARPLLFLHGFMGSSADWDEIMTHLAGSRRCLAIDLPGHGRTMVRGGDECYRMKNCAKALEAFLDERQIEKCDVVAYSMGGRLALYWAATYPKRFERVVLESASPGLHTPKERSERMAQDIELAERLESEPLETFVAEWYNRPMFESVRADGPAYAKLLRRRLENDRHRLSLSLRHMGLGAQPSVWGRLDEIEAALLLIVGEKDDKFVAVAREMLPRCGKAEMTVVAGAGHNVHFEKSAEFAAIVRLFLSEG